MHISKQVNAHYLYHDFIIRALCNTTPRMRKHCIILFTSLICVSWISRTVTAQGWIEPGDGTTTTETAVLGLAKEYLEAGAHGGVDQFRNTLYFTSERDAASIQRGAQAWIDYRNSLAPAQNNPARDVQHVDLIANSPDMRYGVYWIAWYARNEVKPVIKSIEIAVVNNRPYIVYDRLRSAVTEFDVMINPELNQDIVFVPGNNGLGNGALPPPALDREKIDILRIRRDIERWNAVEGEALARMARRISQQFAARVAIYDYAKQRGVTIFPGADIRQQIVTRMQEYKILSGESVRSRSLTMLHENLNTMKANQ